VVQAIDTLSAGGIDSIPDGSITEAKLDPALVAQLVFTDGSHAMVGELDMSGSRIVDLGQPTLPTDAARLADADYTAGAGLLRTDHTLDVVAHADGSIIVGTDSVQVGVLATDTQHGTRGGGTQHATVIAAGAAGFMSGADKTKLDGISPGADVTTVALAAATAPLSVNSQRITNLGAPLAPTDAARVQDLIDATVVAGAGLVRAGTTLNVVADADASIVVAADSLKIGVLATDAQHGTRGGGTQHATVTTTTPGFASAADKTKLDGISAGADVTTVALAAASAPVSVNGQRITNLGTPTAATDAATRAYVDAAPPVLHSSTHADGGADEVNVAGLSGLLADPQTAGGLKTATTTVAIAAAAAPAVDAALMANSSTAAAWRIPPNATTSLPGYMSAADKLKLDGVASSAAAVGSAAASQVTVTTAGSGSAATAARSDHVHSVATAAPSALTVGGAQAPGSSASLARADHVHAMPALVTTSVDGFMVAADKSKLDGVEAGAQVTSFARVQTALAAASSAVSINAQRLTSVADPSAAQDAATKAYVDAIAQGLDVKQSCRVVATTNLGTLSGNYVIDGVTTVNGDRLLLTGQTTASANGIWVTASGAWARATDADTSAKVTSGMYTFIVAGTANADSGWALITPDPIVLGTTALTFTQVTGAGQITAGAGLTKTSNTIDVVAHADGSIVVNADSVQLGVIATDAQHGVRAGGTTHAAVIAAGASGFMTGTDKSRLDSLVASYKTAVRVASVAHIPNVDIAGNQPAVVDGISLAVGDRILVKDQNPTFQTNNIYSVTTVGTGSNGVWAKAADADATGELVTGSIVYVAEGTQAGQWWQLSTLGTITVGTTAQAWVRQTLLLASTAPAAVGTTAAVGVGTTAAHSDHVHAHGAQTDGTLHAAVIAAGASGFMSGSDKTKLDGIATGAAAVLSVTPLQVDGSSGNGGVAVTASRSDHRHQVTAGSPVALTLAATTADGTSNNLARADHVHALPASSTTPTALTLAAAGAPGSSTSISKADHVHALPATASPAALTVGAASAPGSAVTLPRSDHVHAMPGVATTGAAGFMSAADKSRVDLGALPYSASIALNTWSIASTSGTKTLPAPAAVGDCIGMLVTANSVLIAAGTLQVIVDATNTGWSSMATTNPSFYLFRCSAVGIWNVGDSLATSAMPGLMSDTDKAEHDRLALGRVKDVCDAYTDAPVTLSGTGVFAAGLRVLVTAQADATTNGIYTTAAGAWTRAPDADSSADFSHAMVVPVLWYTEGPGELLFFSLNTAADVVLGTTALTFTEQKDTDWVLSVLNNAGVPVDFGGQRLTSVGTPTASTDAANRAYVDAAIAAARAALPRVNQCRISGDSTSPVMFTDNAAISTLYLLPHIGSTISLYITALAAWAPVEIAAAGISLELSGMTTGRPHDVFCRAPSALGGTPTLEIYPWGSTSARAAGTPIVLTDGVWVLGGVSGSPSVRYVGTIYARSATTISWIRNGYTTTTSKCDIWNADNRVETSFQYETAWTGSIATSSAGVWFLPNTGAKFEFIAGRVLDTINAQFTAGVNSGGTAQSGFVGISLNGAEQDHAARVITASGEVTPGTAHHLGFPALGANTLQYQLLGQTTAVVFYITDDAGGGGGNPPLYKYGCFARHMY